MPGLNSSSALVDLVFEALVFIGPLLLGWGALLLAIPSWRRIRAARRAAYGMLAVCLVLLLLASPALIWALCLTLKC